MYARTAFSSLQEMSSPESMESDSPSDLVAGDTSSSESTESGLHSTQISEDSCVRSNMLDSRSPSLLSLSPSDSTLGFHDEILGSVFPLDSGSDSPCASEDGSYMEDIAECFSSADSVDLEDTEGPQSGPLYAGAEITTFESCLLIFQYAVRHSLSSKAFSELLQLVSVHLPPTTQLPKSIYKLKKFFIKLFPHASPVVHFFCCFCLGELPTSDAQCTSSGCTANEKGQFISIPLEPQLKRMMEDKDIWNALQKRFESGSSEGSICDIYDGLKYQEHKAFLSQPANVSLMINTDGVALFHSSKVSLWPVWVVVNELPKTKRYRKRNILLAGMWFARDEPPMNIYLRPIIDELNKLYTEGFEIITATGHQRCHAMLLLCAADLPARAHLTNMKQFNGKCGCLYCTSEGTTEHQNPLHRFWPFEPSSTGRTKTSMCADAAKATRDGVTVCGINGPTVLSLHPAFELPSAIVIDDLHGLYLGVTRLLLKQWFSTSCKTKDCYIGRKMADCDRNLLKIKVPDTISRTPQAISEFSHWKGAELRNWLMFYSLPVLKGILPDPYFSHYSLLVAAVVLLSSECITSQDLGHASDFLKQFYLMFPELYGEKSVTMNIHMLYHLVDCVKNWGPLWVYSCFIFESMNGHLKRFFHGTRDMTKQMTFSYIAMQCLPKLLHHAEPHPQVAALAAVLFGKKRLPNRHLSNTKAIVGGTRALILSPAKILVVNNYLQYCGCQVPCGRTVQVAYRMELNGEIFFSADYKRVHKRNSFTILYKDRFGSNKLDSVQFYIATATTVLAVVRGFSAQLTCLQEHFCLSLPAVNSISCTLIPVTESSDLDITDVDHILEKCILIKLSQTVQYVVRFPHAELQD